MRARSLRTKRETSIPAIHIHCSLVRYCVDIAMMPWPSPARICARSLFKFESHCFLLLHTATSLHFFVSRASIALRLSPSSHPRQILCFITFHFILFLSLRRCWELERIRRRIARSSRGFFLRSLPHFTPNAQFEAFAPAFSLMTSTSKAIAYRRSLVEKYFYFQKTLLSHQALALCQSAARPLTRSSRF